MMKKHFYIGSLILSLMLMDISCVNAWTGSFGTISTGDGGVSGGGDVDIDPYTYKSEEDFVKSDDYVYNCYYKYDTWLYNDITIKMYDMKGNYLNQSTLLPDDSNYKFSSGTGIGLNIFEKSWVGWKIEKQYDSWVYWSSYVCKSQRGRRLTILSNNVEIWEGKFENINENGNYTKVNYDYRDENSCTSPGRYNYEYSNSWIGDDGNTYRWKYYTSYWTEVIEETATDSKTEECQQLAKDEVKSKIPTYTSPSYTVDYYNSNNINPDPEKEDVVVATMGENCENCDFPKCDPEEIAVDNLYTEKQELCEYNYNVKKTCMNQITGDVRYITKNNEDCNSENEIEVPANENAEMTYFVPLNTKSTDSFKLVLNNWQSQSLKEVKQCYYVISNYSDWRNLIIGRNNEKYEGVSTESAKDNIKNNGGCYLATSITFPVTQEFYNEETNENGTKKFSGFNFYYRPIDVSKPFPNGVANNSLWIDVWNKDRNDETNDVKITDSTGTTTTIDLSKSFATITYVASSMNKNKVKNYNDNYANWTNTMDADGTSKFINSGIVNRNIPKNSYYKLGCGPSNKDWEECK